MKGVVHFFSNVFIFIIVIIKNTKMKSIICLAVIICTIQSCQKSELSDCLDESISKFKSETTCDNAKVEEYIFQSKTVYLFDGQSCFADGGSMVMDADCKELGQLGTIVGITKINGEDFANAKFVKTVWKK
jgi:hypothetical protein